MFPVRVAKIHVTRWDPVPAHAKAIADGSLTVATADGQELVLVEAEAVLGPVRPAHPVAVTLPRAHAADVGVPDVAGHVLEPDHVGRRAVGGVEEEEIDVRRDLRARAP